MRRVQGPGQGQEKKLLLLPVTTLLMTLLAAPGCTKIPNLQLNQPSPTQTSGARVDNAPYDALLNRYVHHGLVDYQGLKKEEETLDEYLQGYARIDPARLKTKSERMAYWINAYNAITLAGILHFYPTRSIRSLHGFWDRIHTNCGGRDVTLNEIENKILRPLKDPRIHMAINCASMSCPALLNHAYTGDNLEAQLDSAARNFLGDPRRNRLDDGTHVAYISKIFSWFKENFSVQPYGGIRGFIRKYAPDRSWLKGDFAISYLPYNWDLNEQPAPTSARKSSATSSKPNQHR